MLGKAQFSRNDEGSFDSRAAFEAPALSATRFGILQASWKVN